jgi:type I restriction enzyme M protein
LLIGLLPELYRSVGIDEIENKGWALTPSKYIEFIDLYLYVETLFFISMGI